MADRQDADKGRVRATYRGVAVHAVVGIAKQGQHRFCIDQRATHVSNLRLQLEPMHVIQCNTQRRNVNHT